MVHCDLAVEVTKSFATALSCARRGSIKTSFTAVQFPPGEIQPSDTTHFEVRMLDTRCESCGHGITKLACRRSLCVSDALGSRYLRCTFISEFGKLPTCGKSRSA